MQLFAYHKNYDTWQIKMGISFLCKDMETVHRKIYIYSNIFIT